MKILIPALFILINFLSANQPDRTKYGNPILKIGEVELSEYLVNKYINRAINNNKAFRNNQREESGAGVFLEKFLSKMTVVAHAISKGYQEREEVRDVVGRMKYYMLTQSHGPLFDIPIKENFSDFEELNPINRSHLLQSEVVIVRCGDLTEEEYKSINELINYDIPLEAQLQLAVEFAIQNGFEYVSGLVDWPYAPFWEISDVITELPVNTSLFTERENHGNYLIVKGREHKITVENSESYFENAQHTYRRNKRNIVARIEGMRALSKSNLKISEVTSRKLLLEGEIVSNVDFGEIWIVDANIADSIIYTYSFKDRERTVLASEFLKRFNQRFIKFIPNNKASLYRAIEQSVIESHFYDAALSRGLDRNPKFLEDERGFTYHQILDLYEKEELVPKIVISEAELTNFYKSRSEVFVWSNAIELQVMRFASVNEAMQSLDAFSEEIYRPGSAIVETYIFERDSPLEEFKTEQSWISRSRVGDVRGVIPLSGGEYAILRVARDCSGDRKSFKDVKNEIRQLILQLKLNEMEMKIAAECAHKFEIVNQIPFERLGIDRSTVVLPWN